MRHVKYYRTQKDKDLHKTDEHIMRYVILQLKSTQDRRTNYFRVTPHIRIQVRQTDKLRFLSSLILESKQDRQTDKLRFLSSLILES